MIDPSSSLGALVAEQPSRAEVFERLRLDYCCGGAQTLAQACAHAGLDVETVARMLAAFDAPRPARAPVEDCDWRRASIGELCDHIVAAHHDWLRAELPRLDELVARVVRVHGTDHPELNDLQRLFVAMRRDLESHIDTEERVVFPACRAVAAGRAAVDERALASREREHIATGDALAALRELTQDYDPDAAFCRTYRKLLDSLGRLELDLHQHIHEENNLLFPRARAAMTR